jgi:hypothetical protein
MNKASTNSIVIRSVHNARVPMSSAAKKEALALIRSQKETSMGSELTPTEYLTMEVLAARFRLGQSMWTFPKNVRPTLVRLESQGLIGWKSGVVQDTCRAWLTNNVSVGLSHQEMSK